MRNELKLINIMKGIHSAYKQQYVQIGHSIYDNGYSGDSLGKNYI